jgi:hypothetical protein
MNPSDLLAQEKKKKSVSKKEAQHAAEKFEADALALAYLQCTTDMAKYEHEKNRDNLGLQSKFREARKLLMDFKVNMMEKYGADSTRYASFLKETDKATNNLDICIQYKLLQDSTAFQNN